MTPKRGTILRLFYALVGWLAFSVIFMIGFAIFQGHLCNTMEQGWLDLNSPTCRFLGPLDTNADQSMFVGLGLFAVTLALAGALIFKWTGRK